MAKMALVGPLFRGPGAVAGIFFIDLNFSKIASRKKIRNKNHPKRNFWSDDDFSSDLAGNFQSNPEIDLNTMFIFSLLWLDRLSLCSPVKQLVFI